MQLLEMFDIATKHVSADQKVTLHTVLAAKRQLAYHLRTLPTDTVIIIQLKQYLDQQLETYFTISSLHGVGSLLDP